MRGAAPQILILPLVTATAVFLIADTDSPQWGLIRVVPQNHLTPLDFRILRARDTLV